MTQNQINMNFLFTFKSLAPIKKSNLNTEDGIVWASIENHKTSFAKLINFKLNKQGKFGNQQIKEYLTQLVSDSKKICSFDRKREGVFEGMYGFVSSHYYYLIEHRSEEHTSELQSPS